MTVESWDGRMLKRLRTRRQLSQQALADKVGVHKITIAKLESGARRPSVELLERIARALDSELVIKLKPRKRR